MFKLPIYPFHRPTELDTPLNEPHAVVVVGCGLSGLTVALDLVRRGVRVTLLDDDNTVGVRGLASRGMVWAQRTLDIFDRLGVGDRVVAKGVRWNVGRVLCRDNPVTSFTLQEQPDVRHNGFANLQQYYVEQFLVEALQAEPLAEIRWLNKVTSVRQHAKEVELDVETPEGGYTTRARWVLACDGANSGVRSAIGSQPRVHDRTEDRWIIIDITVRNQQWPEERWTWLDASANNGRAVWRHKMADETWRLDFQLAPGEDASAASAESAMRQRVTDLLGADLDFEIAWSGAWGYRHECLDHLRQDRVFFVGDAAHLVAPFGARGGNGGIQDADNLGWKLALHLQHGAGETLLHSYSEERKRAAFENIRQARRSSRFVFPGGHESTTLWRDAIIALAPAHPLSARMINTGRLCMPAQYDTSALVLGTHRVTGAALPNIVLRRRSGGGIENSLHRSLGPWFTALVMTDRLPKSLPSHPLLKWVAVDQQCDDEGRAAVSRQLGASTTDGSVWLIRPDQHVMAGGVDMSPETVATWLVSALSQSTDESVSHADLTTAA
jgi:3-(3-hydroxy-phenyl)propionate hydroxylase